MSFGYRRIPCILVLVTCVDTASAGRRPFETYAGLLQPPILTSINGVNGCNKYGIQMPSYALEDRMPVRLVLAKG